MPLHLVGLLALAGRSSGQTVVADPAPPSLPTFSFGDWCGLPDCCNVTVKTTVDGQAIPLQLKVCANQSCISLPELSTPFESCMSPELSACVGNQTSSMVAASGLKLGGGPSGNLDFHLRIVSGLVAAAAGGYGADLGGTVLNPLIYPAVQGVPPDMGSAEQCKSTVPDTRYCLWMRSGAMAAGSCVPLECTESVQAEALLYEAGVWVKLGDLIETITTVPIPGVSQFAGALVQAAHGSKVGCSGILRRLPQDGDHVTETTMSTNGFSDDGNAHTVVAIICVIFVINMLSTIILNLPDCITTCCSGGDELDIQDPAGGIQGPAASPTAEDASASASVTVTENTSVGAEGRMPPKNACSCRNEGVKGLMKCFDLIAARDGFLKISPRRPTSFFNGMRVLSIMWVVLGHVIVYPLVPGFDNMSEIDKYYIPSFRSLILGASFYSVDTFFYLSGFLACWGFTDPKKGWKKRNGTDPVKNTLGMLLVYVDRYMRLTPLYAIAIFWAAYVLQYLGTGPFWMAAYHGGDVGGNCAEWWWQNLLYVNNFPKTQVHMCFGHSWYLANDMQFLIVGTPIMVAFSHKPIIGWIATVALMIFTLGLDINRLGDQHLAATGGAEYMRPWIRMAPYLYGLMTSFLIRQYGDSLKRASNNLIMRWAAYAMAFGLLFGAMVFQWDAWQHCGGFISCEVKVVPPGPWANLWSIGMSRFFGFFYHFAWGLGLGILTIVWCCGAETGTGGWIVDFLSFPLFEPLYRLTYGVYLIHPMVLLCIKLTGTSLNHYTDYWLLSTWIAALVGTYVASFLTYIFIERPSSLLWDLASSRNKRSSGGSNTRATRLSEKMPDTETHLLVDELNTAKKEET